MRDRRRGWESWPCAPGQPPGTRSPLESRTVATRLSPSPCLELGPFLTPGPGLTDRRVRAANDKGSGTVSYQHDTGPLRERRFLPGFVLKPRSVPVVHWLVGRRAGGEWCGVPAVSMAPCLRPDLLCRPHAEDAGEGFCPGPFPNLAVYGLELDAARLGSTETPPGAGRGARGAVSAGGGLSFTLKTGRSPPRPRGRAVALPSADLVTEQRPAFSCRAEAERR